MKNSRFTIFDFRSASSSAPTSAARSAPACPKSKFENPQSKSPLAAFTLVEVLMAILIFALSAVILASAYINVLNSYMLVERFAQSNADLTFARSLVLTEPDRKKLEQGGEFETTDGRNAKWEVEIAQTATADLFAVTFTCSITAVGEPEPQKTTQTFMLLRPTWSIDPGERSKLREEAKQRILELQGKKT